jgi:hypothetical protein
MSGCQKSLIGCAIGCGALALIAVVSGAIGAWWLVRPGDQHPTEAVISADARGSFRVADLGADPGVSALLDRFVREAQRQQQKDMPPWMRQMQQMGSAASSPSAGFRMLLPRQATVSLEPSTEGRDDPAVLAAVNPRGMTQLFHMMIARTNTVTGRHRGHELIRLGNDAWATVVGGTWLFSSEEGVLRQGIDRLLDGGPAAPATPANLGLPSRPWDVTGVVEERDAELAHALWGDEPAPDGVRRALLGVDVATSDATSGRVVVECDSAQSAETVALALDRRAAERASELAGDGLALRASSRVDGARAVLDWELSGIDAALAVWMAQQEHGGASQG